MTFLVDERVSCVIMRSNLLVNQESHCTASFHGLWLFLQFVPKMAKMKKTPRKADIIKKKRGAIQVGGCSSQCISSTPILPPRDVSGNPSYKGMNGKYMYCGRVNCMDVKDVGDV